jgi:hypothetical protein
MDTNMKRDKGQPPLVDKILQAGKMAYDPESSEESRAMAALKFKDLLER